MAELAGQASAALPADNTDSRKDQAVTATVGAVGGAVAAFAAAVGLKDGLDTYPFMALTLLLICVAVVLFLVGWVRDPGRNGVVTAFAVALLALAGMSGAVAKIDGPQKVVVHVTAAPEIPGASIKLRGKQMDWRDGANYTLARPFTFDLDLEDLAKAAVKDEQANWSMGYQTAFHSAQCANIGAVAPREP